MNGLSLGLSLGRVTPVRVFYILQNAMGESMIDAQGRAYITYEAQ